MYHVYTLDTVQYVSTDTVYILLLRIALVLCIWIQKIWSHAFLMVLFEIDRNEHLIICFDVNCCVECSHVNTYNKK